MPVNAFNCCAADKVHTIRLELPYDEAGDVLTVAHLAREAENVTGVEVSNQRLIFRGF